MATADVRADRDALVEMITGAWKTRVIGEGVRFGIFDLLTNGAKSADSLAKAVGVDEDGIKRLLRGLAVLGLLRHEPDDCFALTPLGACLRRETPDSLNGFAGHWAGRMWESFAGIGHSFQTGEASAPSGPEHFVSVQADPAQSDVFNRAMAEGSLRIGRALAKSYDFSGIARLRDVGGGYGALLVGPLEANPHLAGDIYDLPSLADNALRYLSEQGLDGRVDYLGGSFFDHVPPGADCLLLKYILHDWNDAKCLTILQHCRVALGKGRLLIIERIVPDTVSEKDVEVIRGDLTMLTVGGKERTEADYHSLLGQAGLVISRILPIDGVFSLIEARVA
ncbi:MAG: hypothetical protein J0I80_08480 [Sphingomonas sp.]|nr:hypothetical protein [Sphingomonas sp.]